MLRECLARRPRATAVGSFVLSTVLVAGISAAKSQAAIDEAPASTGSLSAETPIVKDSRSARQFPRLGYPSGVGRTDGDERPRTKPLSRLAGRISRPAAQAEDIARLASEDLAPEGSESTTPEPSPALVLSDPFNAAATAATAAVETHRAADAESIDDYLFEAYRRLPLKRDATGDFTWKDLAAAARMELSLKV